MNKPSKSLDEFTDNDDVFATDVLYKIITRKHKEYERQHKEAGAPRVPLENISIHLKDCEDYPHILRGINPLQLPDSTARSMLNRFFLLRQLVSAKQKEGYRLSKNGVLYNDLKEILGITQ